MLHVRDDVSLKVSSLHRFILNIAYIESYDSNLEELSLHSTVIKWAP